MTAMVEVRLARRAARALSALQRREQQRIRAALDLLADNPRPPNCVAMQGEESVYRVHVVRIGHRREIYR